MKQPVPSSTVMSLTVFDLVEESRINHKDSVRDLYYIYCILYTHANNYSSQNLINKLYRELLCVCMVTQSSYSCTLGCLRLPLRFFSACTVFTKTHLAASLFDPTQVLVSTSTSPKEGIIWYIGTTVATSGVV